MGKRRIALMLAWKNTVISLWGSYGRMILSFVFAVAISYGTYGVSSALGRDWPGDELIPLFLSGPVLAAIALLVFLFNWLFCAPYELWGNVEERVGELEGRLRPRISVVPVLGQRPVYPAPQEVAVTAGGHVQSNRSLSEQFLCIEVTNNTASTLRACEAYLSRFQEVDGEEPSWHALRLQWMTVGESLATVDIPPLGVRSVVVFKVLGNRALFLTHRLPGDLVHYLKEKAEYEGLVTLTADGTPASLVAFRLLCDAPEHEPTLTVMRRNIGEEPSDDPWAPEEQTF